jgi:hypothetical protein
VVFSWFGELARLAAALPRVEWGRRTEGPALLVARFRDEADGKPRRGPRERAFLQRLIAAIDARLPGEPSCYRRALLEMALDGGAAREPLHLGLRVPGGPRSGHAWLGGAPDGSAVRYDVQVDI